MKKGMEPKTRVIARVFPPLIADRQKKQYTWQITAFTDGYSVSHGYFGGKIQTSDTDISAGKVNRTATEQSIREAESHHKKKIRSGYRQADGIKTLKTTERAKRFVATPAVITETQNEPPETSLPETSEPAGTGSFVNYDLGVTVYYPMLCKIFTDSKQKIVYPCFTQKKIDGVRALARFSEGTVTLQSRNGKFYNLPVIQGILKTFFELNRIPEGWMLDGELHTIDPSKYSFDTISGICRRGLSGTVIGDGAMKSIQYQIYDIAPGSPDLINVPFSQRYELYSRFAVTSENIALVPCNIIQSEDSVLKELDIMIEQGHEGVIIRNAAGVYNFGPARSNDIQKLKRFTDSEYQLAGFKEGKGKNKGMPVLICKVPGSDSKTFKATPDGPAKSRMNMLTYLKGMSPEEISEQMVTVKYQELTPAGIPRFPIAVGTTFRNQYE